MTQLKDIQGSITHSLYLASQATAGTDDSWPVWKAPTNATVTAVTFVPSAAITANGTSYSIYTLTNKGAAGAGTTSVATRSWAATDSAADVPEALTLSGTAANLSVTSGDVLTVVKTHASSGLTIPDGLFVITYKIR